MLVLQHTGKANNIKQTRCCGGEIHHYKIEKYLLGKQFVLQSDNKPLTVITSGVRQNCKIGFDTAGLQICCDTYYRKHKLFSRPPLETVDSLSVFISDS